jgi:hypothetical protein
MKTISRRATAVVGTMAAAVSVVGIAPAQSADLATSRVTATATDYTPASGQTFRIFGAVRSEGVRVPATIRVKTFRNGAWVRLPGAVMQTNRFDNYRIRVVLQMKGQRMLRVVADPTPVGIGNSHKDLTVQVH